MIIYGTSAYIHWLSKSI
uniref:Uncharacterized protein n=1 Tax=Arundo donax TaxID=35708 RepID=A0A0A9A075_ARUDO